MAPPGPLSPSLLAIASHRYFPYELNIYQKKKLKKEKKRGDKFGFPWKRKEEHITVSRVSQVVHETKTREP
jgi:hypothetical protein